MSLLAGKKRVSIRKSVTMAKPAGKGGTMLRSGGGKQQRGARARRVVRKFELRVVPLGNHGDEAQPEAEARLAGRGVEPDEAAGNGGAHRGGNARSVAGDGQACAIAGRFKSSLGSAW